MPYSSEISRNNPSCFLFLVDQSHSMAQPFGGGPGKSKAEGVADAINRLLQTLVLRCAKAEGVRDYYHVGVIGYGKEVRLVLGSPALPMGELLGQRIPTVVEGPSITPGLVPISLVANSPLRVEQRTRHSDDGVGGLVTQTVKFPIWFEPLSSGTTPMCEAIDLAWHILSDYLGRYPHCYPPLAINITDGEASDGDPEPHAICLRDLGSTDGNVLLFNLHLSSRNQPALVLPDHEHSLPDHFAKRLFRMSSPLPPGMVETARREGYAVTEASRGFAFNADLVSVIRFLEIGTRVDAKNLR